MEDLARLVFVIKLGILTSFLLSTFVQHVSGSGEFCQNCLIVLIREHVMYIYIKKLKRKKFFVYLQ